MPAAVRLTKPLTSAQRDVLKMVAKFCVKNGYSPTYEEISTDFGWRSKQASRGHITALVKRGLIVLVPRIARSIRLTPEGWKKSGIKSKSKDSG